MDTYDTTTNLKAADLLERIAEMYGEDPSTWTRGTYARDKYSAPVLVTGATAKCFCLVGALHRLAPGSVITQEIAREAVEDRAGKRIVAFNDSQLTVEPVITACLDAAADLRRKVAAGG